MSHRGDESTRRQWMKLSVASVWGVSFSGWFPGLSRAAKEAKSPKSCILLWMAGGPSQMDTFDPKPDHNNGGPVKAIPTAVPGIHISEYLPGVAKQMDDLAIIRNMNSGEGDHRRGSQLMLTGYKPNPALAYPSMGSLLSKELGSVDNDLPNYVSLSSGRFGQVGGAGFLGPQYNPLVVSGDSDNPSSRANLSINDLAPPQGVSKASMKRRFDALAFLQGEFNKRFESSAALAHQANTERAARMIETQARNAFKLDEEKSELRDAYGRSRFGQGCLLARRLVERGVPFVEVSLAGVQGDAPLGWDTHGDNFDRVNDLCDVLDPAWSTLMNDLRDRGMLDSTMIIWMGEFGRTPKINDSNGRDHWSSGWSTVLGGAGIQGGQVIGDTGTDGMRIMNHPDEGVSVPELYATICSALEIDHEKENMSPGDRPVTLVDKGHSPIKDLLA